MKTINSGLLISTLLTSGILFLAGAGIGWWLASGCGEQWIPEQAKLSDYVQITAICGLIPGFLGALLGAGVYMLVKIAKESKS